MLLSSSFCSGKEIVMLRYHLRYVFLAVLILCGILAGVFLSRFILAEGREVTRDTDLCYISAYEVDEVIDGTEPFDGDSQPGNDDGANNGIVRSFDAVNYTLKYTTAIKDSSMEGITSAYVCVDFVLPMDPREARFNMDTMQWCVDPVYTYEYEDGTSSTTWDLSKTVLRQRVTGKRLLQNTENSNTIPGTGTLSCGLDIYAAVNNTKIQPSFTIWMEGNPEEEKQTVTPEELTVSAAPKYNINLRSSQGVDFLGEFEKGTGKIVDEQTDTSVYGRLSGYSLVVQLYNDNANKGMRGIEFPSGDITFDIRLKSELNDKDVTMDPDWQLSLWDYIENNAGTIGKLGRNMQPRGAQGYAWYGPGNKGTGTAHCTDGGQITMTQDAKDAYLYHVSVTDYAFDWENFEFPIRYLWSNEGNVSYTKNIGCFSAGNLVFLSEFPREVQETSTLYSDITVSNLRVESSGKDEITEMVTSDNRVRKHIVLYPNGAIAKYMRYYSSTTANRPGTYLASVYSGGDNAAGRGTDLWIQSFIHGRAEYSWSDFNLLQKFDDECLDLRPDDFIVSTAYTKEPGDITMLYAAKPDKSGWTDDMEMNLAREEDLIYFKSIEDLKEAGYTCVAVLYEIRGCQTYPVSTSISYFTMYFPAKVKETAEVGSVYQLVSDLRAWRQSSGTQPFSWTDLSYNQTDKSYGLGDPEFSGYIDSYQKPYVVVQTNENTYTKVSYKDGVMYGHNGGYTSGNSLLIVSNQVGVQIEGADITGSSIKHVYDLDAGERTAAFTVQPVCKMLSANAGATVEGLRDTLRVEVQIPGDLHYNETGASRTPDEVTVHEDGSTSVIWYLKDVEVGSTIDPITFSVTIGEEGTVNDVQNNESFNLIAKVTSENDTRATTKENGNYSETSISVIRLAASAVTKRAIHPIVESGQEIGFRLRYSNLSDTVVEDAVLYDILPFDGDTAGSDFSGAYHLSRILVDYAHAPKTLSEQGKALQLSVTKEEAGRTDEVRDSVLAGQTDSSLFTALSGRWDGTSVTYDGTGMATALAAFLGDVSGNEYIDIYLYLSPAKDGELLPDAPGQVQQPGDIYANRFYQNADNQAAVVISNIAQTTVANRTLSGLVWEDRDHDGIREEGEPFFDGARITLYRTTPSGSDDPVTVAGTPVYPAYDVLGNKVDPVVTDADGTWSFSYLEAGTYLVQVTGTDEYYVTVKDAGEDDTLDSDAAETEDSAYLDGIQLPELANLTAPVFSSEHHDTGLVRHTKVSIRKTDGEGNPLPGAQLELYAGEDVSEDDKPLFAWTSKETPYVLTDTLLVGKTYTLVEAKAPDGYLTTDPVTFTVKDTVEEQVITMVDLFRTSSLTLKKLDGRGNPLEGVTFRLTFTNAQGNAKGNYLLLEGESVEAVTDEEGMVRFTNLNRGSYRFEEIQTVEGQALLPDAVSLELPLTLTEDEVKELGNVDTVDAVFADGTYYFFDCTYEIVNDASLSMPKAGGEPFYTIAGLGCLAAVAGTLLLRRRTYKK